VLLFFFFWSPGQQQIAGLTPLSLVPFASTIAVEGSVSSHNAHSHHINATQRIASSRALFSVLRRRASFRRIEESCMGLFQYDTTLTIHQFIYTNNLCLLPTPIDLRTYRNMIFKKQNKKYCYEMKYMIYVFAIVSDSQCSNDRIKDGTGSRS